MESIVFNHDRGVHITRSNEGIPICHMKDYTVNEHEISVDDQLIAPGYILNQSDGMLTLTYPNGSLYFSVACTTPLKSVRLDHNLCIGHQHKDIIHMFSFEHAQPTSVKLCHASTGWCLVPNTKCILHWDSVRLTVTNTADNTHENLRGHFSSVCAADASTSIAVSGDRTGYICIWFVASWKKHHYIRADHRSCQQILLYNDLQVAIRSEKAIHIYDVTTGTPVFQTELHSKSMQWCSRGLVVATGTHIRVYDEGTMTICFQNNATSLIPAQFNRIWSVSGTKATELRFHSQYDWTAELLEWIEHPTFPCTDEYWPKRYLDVLAMSVTQWMPKLKEWTPPRIWFRHSKLRNAIWDMALDTKHFEYAKRWNFLPAQTRREWYRKCEHKLMQFVQDEAFSNDTARLLNLSYAHLELKTNEIIEWCWRHHGQLSLRKTLAYFLSHDFDGQYMRCISRLNSTCDAILCVTSDAANLAIQNGHMLCLIEWMLAFHKQYPFHPTHHMRAIYARCLLHIYTNLDKDDLRTPIETSGQFLPLKTLSPAHKGAYISCNNDKGFITSIEFGTVTSAEWRPIGKSTSQSLDTSDTSVWCYHNKQGPHTMLECALFMLNKDHWSTCSQKVPWLWFTTNVGASLCVGKTILLDGGTANIESAGWCHDIRYIVTDTRVKIYESDDIELQWMSDTWSYLEQAAYHIVPLQLKLCHSISAQLEAIALPTTMAAELVKCMHSDPVETQCTHTFDTFVTALAEDGHWFYVGSKSGVIYEYENMLALQSSTRTFDGHEFAIQQMYLMGSRLLSLCHKRINIWNVRSGKREWSLNTNAKYVAVVPMEPQSFCLINDQHGMQTMVVWDIVSEMPIQTIDTPEYFTGSLLTSCLPEPCVLLQNTLFVLQSQMTIPIETSMTTCIFGTDEKLYGATSNGSLFMLNWQTRAIREWTIDPSLAFSSMAVIEDLNIAVLGSSNGVFLVWDMLLETFVIQQTMSSAPIHAICSESLFTAVATYHDLHIMSIIPEKASLVVQALHHITKWSHAWKTRLLKDAQKIIEPAIFKSLSEGRENPIALQLLNTCTEEYEHRGMWCSSRLVDILLTCPEERRSQNILRRLVSFRGPRFDCAICNDEDKHDSICFLETCHHRFHSSCIQKLIEKTPEYHDEVQYDYALSFTLRCPICRSSFSPDDVGEDTLLNKYLYIPYSSLI